MRKDLKEAGNVRWLSGILTLKPTNYILLSLDSEHLIKRCRQGDAKAQQWVYDTHATSMFRLCYRYIRNQTEAEDLLLQGFYKVFEHFATFEYRNEKSLAGWIKKIMVNECLMFLRKTTNFNLTCSLDEDRAAQEQSTAAEPESSLSAEEIYTLIRELPVGYRTVFNLYVLEGYSHKEIADQLQISEFTSRSQLSKAKATLRTLLTKNNLYYAAG